MDDGKSENAKVTSNVCIFLRLLDKQESSNSIVSVVSE
jgi:hypothetical protein